MRTIWIAGLTFCLTASAIAPQKSDSWEVWVQRKYESWDNPLHSTLKINGKVVNAFSAEAREPIAGVLHDGWNTISISTHPQQNAARDNDLEFRFGPVKKDRTGRPVMSPVVWEFRNGTDWKWNDGRYTHAAGPDYKEIEVTFVAYLGDLPRESSDLVAGDYVVEAECPEYESWNSRITTTLSVNGTLLTSFMGPKRQVRITPYLKQGKNEILLITRPVDYAYKENGSKIEVLGPAEWMPNQANFQFRPVLHIDGMEGWKNDPKTGALINAGASMDKLERVVSFVLKEKPRSGE